MSSQRYQRVNAHDEEDDTHQSHSSIPLRPNPTPSSPPPSFRSRSSSPSRRLLHDDSRRDHADQTLADAFGDGSESEGDDEPDDRQRLMRAQPESRPVADSSSAAAASSSSSGSDQSAGDARIGGGIQRRQTLLPSFSTPSPGAGRVISSANDGVFANLAAKPERGEKNEDLPPSYEEAAADATPPYWETTILAPGISSDEVFVDGLPVGSIFSFVWNAMISMSFQLVGFLLTYLLHTTHAAKNGSRAGLGLTLVQYGFYMKGGGDSKGSDDGGSDYVTPPDPNSHSFDPNNVDGGSGGDGSGGGAVSAITTSEWISYVLMIVGWFILIRAISDFLRARRHEQLVLQSPERGLSVPVDAAGDGDPASVAATPTPGLPKAPVEARSLSSITAIASNPPAYPRNPTQKKLEPLVLYIVRVPGSRDVFLSPLKPPTKASVSAEAINSSLYYLHVATPDDDLLLEEYEQEREEEARLRKEEFGDDAEVSPSPEFARLNNVKRKPVPGGGNPANPANADANAPPPPPPPPPLPSRPRPTSWQSQETRSPSQIPDYLQRPPVPPRPSYHGGTFPGESCATPPRSVPSNPESFPEPFRTEDAMAAQNARPSRPLPPVPKEEPSLGPPIDPMPTKKANRWSAALSGYIARGEEKWKEKYDAGRQSLDSRRPQIRPHSAHGSPSHSRMESPLGSPAHSPGQSPALRPHEHRVPDRRGFHITLIRRDPTHGSQWNVATMSTPRLDGGAIDIDIFTPGYSRFLAQNEPLSLASLGMNLPTNGLPLSLASFKPPQADPAAPYPTSTPNEPSHPRRFQRKLCVSRPYFQEEARGGSLDLPGRPSLDSIASVSSTMPHAPSHSKLKSGYYTFTSPWNGICTFSTSVNGRSLKCKHMIPTPGLPAPNPSAHPTSMPESPAITVAEIRFNTPFQAGHLHQPPGPSHVSPFALSQASALRDPSATHSASPPNEISYLASPQTPTASSKRSSLAQFLNPNNKTRPRARSGASINSNHVRNLSNSSTSSAGGAGGPEEREKPAPLRRPPSDDRLDLSLAREAAGGGMRGKSAKLGKLIIEDEGIKMLDLVVAAGMSVWWRGYYY
ncbi:hypothetical protein BO71DRAFT_444246 [Aspergillus ellipticus CBS 707.79]|uniref:Metal homeostatis protein bsd2 n=1 Tax=Aspergillus ellipticus CBS 707.79 TaxID=1448320 RepID=A0A319D5X7_9EURO|nr:hypothetical protein BO71DRAFT_444246 [Aspergillus ellipticus CBS 707.79]